MTVSSGLPPYDYGFTTPIRSDHPNPSIGPSGSLLEAAQFVITAEYRRMNKLSDPAFNYDFTKYKYAGDTGEVYEPQPDGNNLNDGEASLTILDHILDTRDALFLFNNPLFLEYEKISNYSQATIARDWMEQLYPDLPIDSFPYFRRTAPTLSQTPIVDSGVLGGSGVLMDVDFGEVMFNPFPFIARSDLVRTHGPDDVFLIWGSPAFPGFHKTDGSLISLNGREPVLDFDGFSDEDYYVEPIASGKMKLDGYVLRSQTEYLYSDSQYFDGTIGFTSPIESDRSVTPDIGTLETGRVYVSPLSKSAGVWRIGAANRKADFPSTTVESGIVSTWPQDAEAYDPNETDVSTATVNFQEGFHVFDDSMWILDRGLDSPLNNVPSSGLCLIAPKTGHILWDKFASTTLSGDSLDSGGGTIDRGRWWRDHVGLEVVGTTIYRCKNRSTAGTIDPFSGFSRTKHMIQTYNLDLDYSSEIITGNAGQLAYNRTVTDIMYDGTDWWVFALGSGPGIAHLNASFGMIESATFGFINAPGSPTFDGGKAAYINGTYYVWGLIGNILSASLRSFTIVTPLPGPPPPEEFPTMLALLGNNHTFDLTSFNVEVGAIHDMQEVSSTATGMTAGTWILFAGGPPGTGPFAASMYLARITLAGTVFTGQEIYKLALATPYSAIGSTSVGVSRSYDMIHAPV